MSVPSSGRVLAERHWDVIVIGAGPAGSLAARQSALGGARTLLVERKPFPREKVCGACLSHSALEVLERVGLAGEIGRLGGVPLREFRVGRGARNLTLALPEGLALSRSRFDAALAGAAVAAGAVFRSETSATVGGLSAGAAGEVRLVALRGPAGAVDDVQAKVVIAADGLGHSSLDAHVEFASRIAPAAHIGLGATLTAFPAFYRPGTIFMAVGRGGYVGLVRVEAGRLNMAAAMAPDFVRAHGSPATAIAEVLADGGWPAIPEIATAHWHGTLPLTRRSARLAGRRILLLGDAAGYVEPFTGEGMAWALAMAVRIEPFLIRGLADWNAALESEWSLEYRRMAARRQRWCRWLSMLLRHPRLSRGLLSLVARAPRLARPIVRELNAPLVPASGGRG